MRSISASVMALALTLVMVALPAAVARAQQAGDPEAVVRGMVDAFGAGDIAGFASYLSEDATATGFCRPAGVCRSKAEIISATSEEIAEKVHPEIRSLSVDGDTVTVALTESTEAFAPLGIQRVYINLQLTVRDGKVISFDDQFDTSDAQTAKFVQALQGETSDTPSTVPATGTGPSATADERGIAKGAETLVASGVALIAVAAAWRRFVA